jgi:hypothetical protein
MRVESRPILVQFPTVISFRMSILGPYHRIGIGLGDLIKTVMSALGVKPCAACTRRAAVLNALVAVSGVRRSVAADCLYYSGECTGFGNRRCVSGPREYDSASPLFEQCCDGWFQYPWIEVCRGEQARSGCGFCLW